MPAMSLGLRQRKIHPQSCGISSYQRQKQTNMSLDKTSHRGRPGPEELVPSRYALRVGEIDVLVVSDGVLSLPGAMLAHNADPAVRAAWLNDMFLPPDVRSESGGNPHVEALEMLPVLLDSDVESPNERALAHVQT